MSSSSRLCRPYGNNFSRTGVPPWIASVLRFADEEGILRRDGEREWLGFRRDQLLQFTPRKPLLICVARISESLRQRPRTHPVLRLPPGMRRLNDKHFVGGERLPRLVLRDEHFMQLFSGTDSDILH